MNADVEQIGNNNQDIKQFLDSTAGKMQLRNFLMSAGAIDGK
jgi:hypothetical protein